MATKADIAETRRAKIERKEQAILSAAREIFVAHGFDGARMSEIARRASIGEGTIYSYYESKAELMLAVLQQFWDGLTLEAEAVMASPELARHMADMQTSAMAMGLVGTPTFFVNGKRHRGPWDAASLIRALQDTRDSPRP